MAAQGTVLQTESAHRGINSGQQTESNENFGAEISDPPDQMARSESRNKSVGPATPNQPMERTPARYGVAHRRIEGP